MRQPLYLRLRPFLRRELRARLVSAVVTVFVLSALAWLGVSALTRIDSREAHMLRVSIGIEDAWAVCDGPSGPTCTYDDREQTRVDAKHAHERRLRLAVLDELDRRIEHANGQLDHAIAITDAASVNPRNGALEGDTVALRQALASAAVELSPAPLTPVEDRRERLLWALDVAMPGIPADCHDIGFDGIGWTGGCDLTRDRNPTMRTDQKRLVYEQVNVERETLATLSERIAGLRSRERGDTERDASTSSRVELVADLVPTRDVPSDYADKMSIAGWLAVGSAHDVLAGEAGEPMESNLVAVARTSGVRDVGTDLATIAMAHPADLAVLVTNPLSAQWHDGWGHDRVQRFAITTPSVRYRSPVATDVQARLFATILMLLGTVLLVVVGPTVTATTTAREREAGTLPVLRMTGLSAGDLAMAMTIGPNVFALIAGGALVVVSTGLLAASAGLGTALSLAGLVLVLSAVTHLTAIGLGDALGQRVNAMVVGGLLGLGVLVPGLVGATMVVGDMAATGLLLGPLPAALASAVAASGLPYARMLVDAGGTSIAPQILAYSVVAQGLLGVMCLLSWRRRAEQPWAPLFRPFEGALLGLVSVGCSAIALLDLSAQVHVQTYDQVNLVTFVATGFLMPVLGWLLVSSLVRPARAAAVASCGEVRRAFLRFQAFIILTGLALAGAYTMVLDSSGVGHEKSEVMWATIAQGLLVAQTTVATLLLASRRREGRHRVLIVGAAIVVLQLALTAGVYSLEVEHVALTQSAAHPLLVGMDASPYWIAFLVVLWAAGLGLVLTALLRERDRSKPEANADEPEPEGDGDDEHRWLH